MEAIIGILIWVAIIFGVGRLFRAGKAVAKTALGDGTLKENLGNELYEMGALELRGQKTQVGEIGHKVDAIELEVRGLFPIQGARQMSFVTSVFDEATSGLLPVVSVLHTFQEDCSSCFQFAQDVGTLKGGYGFRKWVRIGIIPLQLLQAARKGNRQLLAVVRLVDTDDKPEISNGFSDGTDKIFWTGNYKFPYYFAESGWQDEAEGSRVAACVTVKLGVALAMADGELHEEEGNVIKAWIAHKISGFSGGHREEWRSDLNNALREGFDLARAGNLVLSDLTAALMENGSPQSRLACIDMLYEVIGADGKAESEELALVKKIAAALEIDSEELKSIADQKLVGVHATIESETDLEQLLDIDPSWDGEQIKRHLRELFQKWNNRMTSLTDAGEKEYAQRMLHLIAEARKKYQ